MILAAFLPSGRPSRRLSQLVAHQPPPRSAKKANWELAYRATILMHASFLTASGGMLRLPIRSRMLDIADSTYSAPTACSVSLDNEAEVQICVHRKMEISERGMRFACCREFPLGTQLAVSMMHMHPRFGLCRMTLEGVVAWCEPCDGDRYESTVLFLELPDELRPCLREFSHQLATS
jgi:hypothetical protein